MNKRKIAAMLAGVMLLTAGCGKKEQKLDGASAVELLRNNAAFNTKLSDVGEDASVYFPGLPEGSKAVHYGGSGYFADEIVLITVENSDDLPDAMRSVEKHLEELRTQFLSYIPEEMGKIDNAVVYETDNEILLCITDDYDRVNQLLAGKAVEPATTAPETAAPTASDPLMGTTAAPTSPAALPETTGASASEYPVLQSKSGTYQDYGNNAIRVDDTAFELYGYLSDAAGTYAKLVNQVADALQGQTQVYALAIPTAVGVVLPDDIAAILPSFVDQGKVMEKIYSQMNSSVIPVRCFENMMNHRDEYLYFHTDYHWNGKGAYYAYESFCETKGVAPIPLQERTKKTYSGFLGALYSQSSNQDPILKGNPDTVEAYCPKSQSATMQFTDRSGKTCDWNIITDVTDWDAGTKYSAFAASDNPISVFTNPDVQNDSVCIVVKESYGNALMSYLVDHYHTIYEIDYRYWEGDLVEFAKEKQADDLLFANNLTMISTNLLVGMLGEIIGD